MLRLSPPHYTLSTEHDFEDIMEQNDGFVGSPSFDHR